MKKIDRKKKRRIIYLLLIIGLFIGELIVLGVINIPFIEYFNEDQVSTYKNDMAYFSGTHQNPTNRLFIEPTIDVNYRAIGSINFSSFEFINSSLINPRNNSNLRERQSKFFLDYLFDKQNPDGSFSDIGGLGEMYTTFKVVSTIDILNNTFLDASEHQDKVNKIVEYVNNSLDEGGWGFKNNAQAPEADIISTYYAIKLAKRLNAVSILKNNNDSIIEYIESLGNYTVDFLGTYRFSNNSYIITAETTYFGIRSYLEMNKSYTTSEKWAIAAFYIGLYSNGGYRSSYLRPFSDISSTYYSLWTLYYFNNETIFPSQTQNYIQNSSKSDGGFGPTPYLNSTSNFISGWAAMKSISLLEINETDTSINFNNSYKLNYYNWLYEYQAINGLFGQISLQSNYLGVLALYNYNSETFTEYIDMNKILDFANSCYNPEDGGFGSEPYTNSSIFSTYCAIFLYQKFRPYTLKNLPNATATIDFLVKLQDPDGGFKLGEDLEVILSYFGPVYNLFLDFIDTNISTTESTYWAIKSLDDLNSLNLIDQYTLTHWISSGQNADGGFSVIHGFHSDVISTYYGLEILKILNINPLSKSAAIEFLKGAQSEDGSFTIIPFLSILVEIPSSFIATYLGSIALYEYRSQPENIKTLTIWYRNCISQNTGGVGDIPNFGGDLRNTPYGLVIIDEIRFDQAFDPQPWSNLLVWLMISEVLILVAFIILSLISYLNTRVIKFLKSLIGMAEKLNINYLKKFPAVYCENLNIYIGKKLIVDGVSLELHHGEILGVLGESGAGKSTFVKALLGMRKYTGICELYGMDVKKNKRKVRPIYGYVPQDLGKIYTNFTTLQNLIYFGKQYGLTEKEIVSRAKRLLRSLEIEDKMNELVKNLSGGQKRRVSIAMGLIHNPIFCILDEPTSGLDPLIREQLWLSLTEINEKYNTTLIVISHYPEESRFCNKVVVFGRGRGMIDFGTPQQLLSQLPGGGRTIELYFYDGQENAVERLEKIPGIEEALENKMGTDFAILTDLNLNEVRVDLEKEFGEKSILGLKQSDTVMEQYFRYRAMEVPELE